MQKQQDLYPTRIDDQPRIVDRVDPVVYSDPVTRGPLDYAQLDDFEHKGFLHVPEFFSGDTVATLQDALHHTRQAEAGSGRAEVVEEPDSGEVRSVFAVHRDYPVFGELCRDQRLLRAVFQLLGSDAYIHQSRINFKPGFRGKEFYWHSDFETWHAEDGMPRMRAVSCLIPMTPNNQYNGALMLIPGSHRHYISCVGETPQNHYKQSLKQQRTGVPDDDSLRWLVDKYGIEAPATGPGSVLFFDCNVMHGSNSNISPFPRSNVFMVFNSVYNTLQAPFSADSPRPEFLATRQPRPLGADKTAPTPAASRRSHAI